MSSKSKSLFVTEEDDDDEEQQKISIPPENMEIDSKENSEDDDDPDSTVENEGSDEDDDPVVHEIPLFINSDKNKESENLYLFQYISQLASKPINKDRGIHIGEARIKPVSQAVEIDIPLDTSRFYDSEKGEIFNNMTSETFGGHLVNNSNGLFFLSVLKNGQGDIKDSNSISSGDSTDKKFDNTGVDTKDTKKAFSPNFRLMATPIEKLAQIRQVFHHIDNFNIKLKQQEELDVKPMSVADEKAKETATKVQVVQMTAKSAGSENEIRYSEAIQTVKKAEEEDFIPVTWYEQHEGDSQVLKQDLSDLAKFKYEPDILQVDTRQKYLDDLLADKFVKNFNL